MGLVERLDFRPHKQEAQPKQAKDKKGHKKWAEIDRYIVDLLVPRSRARRCTSHEPSSRAAAHQCLAQSGQVANGAGTSRLRSCHPRDWYTWWLQHHLACSRLAPGELITLEANPMHAKIARANVAHAGLADRVDMRLGKALELTADACQ